MPPEQATGDNVDESADVYALGPSRVAAGESTRLRGGGFQVEGTPDPVGRVFDQVTYFLANPAPPDVDKLSLFGLGAVLYQLRPEYTGDELQATPSDRRLVALL